MLSKQNDYLTKKLQELLEKYSKISELISAEKERAIPNELATYKMQKQQLILKEQIEEVKSKLLPDIIA